MGRARGRVKSFDDLRGYGFIEHPDGDVLVHFSEIQVSGYRTLSPGQWVDFEWESHPRYAGLAAQIHLLGAVMKTIIAGSRDLDCYNVVSEAVDESQFSVTEVVSGTARGVDKLGERWAADHGVPVKRFPADWEGLGKAAGPIRNQQMAAYGDALVAVVLVDEDGNGTRGTEHMIRSASALGLHVYVKRVLRQVGKKNGIDG